MELRLEKNSWDKIRAEAELYELKLPTIINSLPEGQEIKWMGKDPKERSSWRSQKTAIILEVIEVYVNPKGTVKAIVAGKDKRTSIFSREVGAEGFSCLGIDRYSPNTSDIFDNINKGTFLITETRYHGEEVLEVSFVSKEKKIKDVVKILDILDSMDNLLSSYAHFQWHGEATIPSYGTVSLNEVTFQYLIFLTSLRKLKWMKRKQRWDLWNAVKANLTIKNDKTSFSATAKGLDGNTYELKCSRNAEEGELGWNEQSLLKMDFWIPFVYREPKDSFFNITKDQQKEQLLDDFLRIYHKLNNENFELGYNKKKISITRKILKKGARLVYIDGKLTKSDDVVEKLRDFFLRNKPIIEEEMDEKTKTILGLNRTRVMSQHAQGLLEHGLEGIMRDLEGEFPFHLNINYKEHKWYLEIAGREFYIKGGYNELARISSAIHGHAILDHSEEGYDPRATKIVRKRLAVLVGDEEALWIVLQVKKMGALVKAMSGK